LFGVSLSQNSAILKGFSLTAKTQAVIFSFFTFLRRFLFMKTPRSSERGQTMMEYVIVSVLIGIICIAGFKSLGSTINKKTDQIKKKINKELDSVTR
jgi:Flp pilus assembly pilin Flp